MSLDPEATADRRLAQVSSELAAVAGDVQDILATATSSLSRIFPATWVAVVMNPDPETSRVVAGNDTDRVMADWVGAYIAAIDSPDRVPTVGVSQQVIGSGEPLVKPRVSYEDFLKMLSPAGQAFTRAHPLPHATDMVGMLLVPMRIGGAIIGTLGMFDWKAEGLVNEEDLAWVQPIADRIALSLEHARLLGTARDDAERMDLVRAITLASRHGQDQRTTLRSIVEQVTGLLDVDAAEILLPSADGKDLLVAASAGFRSSAPPEYRLPIDDDMRAAPPSAPRVDHVPDLDRRGRNPRRSQFAREGFQTFVRLPLQARNGLVGMLELYNRPLVEWGQDWLDFFDTLGSLTAVAIEHAAATAPSTATLRAGSGAPRPQLSELELDILRLVAEGFTNRDIAQQVHRSENTIKFHVRRILERTGASNRTELARRATREGWL